MPRSTRLGLSVLCALFGFAFSVGEGAHAADLVVHVRGNVAITEDVYRTLLSVARCGADAVDPAAYAAAVRACVEDFLSRSGYELAAVQARVMNEREVELLVDEGRLDRVVITGAGAFTTFRLRFALDLPGNVFNRPLLDRKLASIRENFNIDDTRYALHRVHASEPRDVQLRDSDDIDGITLLSPQQPYELRIECRKNSWTTGARLSFGFDPPDGLFIRGGTRVPGVLLDGDRLKVDGRIGIRIVDAFRSSGTRLGLSRAALALNQSTPPFISDVVSAFLDLSVDLTGRVRRDLQVDSFLYVPVRGTLNTRLRFSEEFSMWAGFGVEQRYLFDVRAAEGMVVAPAVAATERKDRRLLGEVGAEILIGRDELRLDRDHAVNVVARHYFSGTERESSLFVVHANYKRVFAFGWDELWIGGRAGFVGGDVPFYNEISIGEGFLRGGFSGEFYSRKLVSLNAEYRVSVSRDVLKISLFNDLAGFIELSPEREELNPLLANTVGLGLHVLVLDAFQVNAYSGVALSTNGKLDVGFALRIVKAF